MRYIVLFLIIIVLYTLGSALFFMLRKSQEDSVKMARALTWRIGLSLFIFLLLILAYSMGWMHPHGLILVVPK